MPGHNAFSPGVRDAELEARREAAGREAMAVVALPLPGSTARELAGPLAYQAMRDMEAGMALLRRQLSDRDERIAANAARAIVTACPKVAALEPVDAPAEMSPADKDAALRAALESADFCALLVRVVGHEGSAARAALLDAGWTAPDAD